MQHRSYSAIFLVYLALSPLLTACEGSSPGTIVGDVFLAEGLGREINVARLPLHLLEEDAELDSVIARICPTREGAVATSRTAAQEQAWRERTRILEARVQKTVTTDAQARFRIDSVAPGRYRLWADTTIDATRWTWLQPVTVQAGDSIRVNLTNDNPDHNPFRCRS